MLLRTNLGALGGRYAAVAIDVGLFDAWFEGGAPLRALTRTSPTAQENRVEAARGRLHDLRHSFASDALMAGVPLAIVGEMLGHKNPTTTQRYAHLADGVVRDALELATRRIMDATEEGPVVAKEVRFSPLTDAQWRRVAPLVDGSRPRTGRHVDLRDIVDGVRWVQERGARWREVPERFGAPTTCWRWYKRWVESGVWDRVAAVLG